MREIPIKERLELSSTPVTESGCWIWLRSINADGYGVLHRNHKTVLAHRTSYEAFRGEIPEGLCVCHSCDITYCINPDHLFLGTHLDNMRDAKKKSRNKPRCNHGGENHPLARLTSSDVIEIRKSTDVQTVLAKRFGVSQSYISEIKLGKKWKHVLPAG